MYVSVIHSISDPERFWEAADQRDLPEGMQVHSAFPSADGKRAVCLWEADSVQAIQDTVENLVGQVSRNEYFEVATQNAIGLPTAASSG